MKRKHYISVLLLFFPLLVYAFSIDSLLLEIDKTIDHRTQLVHDKQKEIAPYLLALRLSSDELRIPIYANLVQQYKNYRLDSALYYSQTCVNLTEKFHRYVDYENAVMAMIEIKKKIGQSQEAMDMLNLLNPLSPTLNLHYYYHLHHSINYLFYRDALTEDEKRMYKQRTLFYLQKLVSDNKQSTVGYVCNKSEEYLLKGRGNESLKLLLDYNKDHPKEVFSNSFLSYSFAETYHALGNPSGEAYYLALTSLSDLRGTKKEYMALQQLAVLLYKRGDIVRAYKYITCSMEDIAFCRARCRIVSISEFLPIITATYEYKMKKENGRRMVMLAFISLLSFFLIIAFMMLLKRNRKLAQLQISLDGQNEQLIKLNDRLIDLNSQLGDSNRIKEAYIGQLFDLCSSYINKQKDYRVSLRRKIVAGKIVDIQKELNDSVLESEELKSFFRHFDEIFLKLFPHFIESFNKLIQEDKPYYPKKNELLSPELRIYALVRLGINDSTKIAELLHYSVQTVYNYRMRVRNNAIIPKEQFVSYVQRLD